ncbi:transcription antitermination factor NusB [Peredibacter starrii]|uniref:Transcription antitermination protein NusB n=1 Tax=Peredibacter starrii TaxID=28202 RepID=A0AAX4HS03_9BACT|nr:transcription antitermination factor NusB [Peredibacter starrii]WPU66109.1 transcription antitermination factor NusB [Peredibacter starrii]
MSTKREAREFCLQFLYHFQLAAFQDQKKELDSTEIFARMQEFRQTLSIVLDSEAQAYVATLVSGILKTNKEIEEILVKYLKNWKLSRISKIEHTIFMMAIYELKYHPEVPGKVVINEAIELGKKYSTKESAGFLNGILDNVFKQELNRNE